MALSPAAKSGFAICLVLTILLVALHLAVAATGHEYYKESSNPGYIYLKFKQNKTLPDPYNLPDPYDLHDRDYHQFAAFLIIAAGLTFFISIILLIALCRNSLTSRTRHILATLNLIIEFAIAVTLSINASTTSNLRDAIYNYKSQSDIEFLNYYYRLLIADAVITFVLEIVYLVVIYFGTLDQIQHTVLTSTLHDPPITADRLN